MPISNDIHEHDVIELNRQLYSAYDRIRELNVRVADLEEEIKGTVELIAQADTNGALRNHENSRMRILVDDAKTLTKKLDLFNYWD